MTGERVYVGIQDKIKGLPTIKQCKVLANRRNILTKYSNGTIAMFDVFTGEKGKALYLRYDYPVRIEAVRSNSVRSQHNVKLDQVEVFESTDWEECLKQCEQLLYVPNWFSGESFEVPSYPEFQPQFYTEKMCLLKNRSRTVGTLGISIGPSAIRGRVVDMKTTFTQ